MLVPRKAVSISLLLSSPPSPFLFSKRSLIAASTKRFSFVLFPNKQHISTTSSSSSSSLSFSSSFSSPSLSPSSFSASCREDVSSSGLLNKKRFLSICNVSDESVAQEEERILEELSRDMENLYQEVQAAANRFKSPMYKQYFTRRADEDFAKIREKMTGKRRQSFSSLLEDVENFKERMQKHRDLLNRQATVGNLYHTDHIVYLK
ncbi:hypothetical protein CSUI_001993 [Cystoisospora suis]|uniref:Uncharacterized protein n=1 Tax=Cystoisospora suis TaxID=483139 RepID=A0A2C6LAP4_9APIC|nr:hypothetical protein CSUI_001993 [Cystoisospora suis]